jgi:hypothetical protein
MGYDDGVFCHSAPAIDHAVMAGEPHVSSPSGEQRNQNGHGERR